MPTTREPDSAVIERLSDKLAGIICALHEAHGYDEATHGAAEFIRGIPRPDDEDEWEELPRAVTVECESCKAVFLSNSKADALCHGCGKIVCQSCADAFDHYGKGAHGVGNPSALPHTVPAAILAVAEEMETNREAFVHVAELDDWSARLRAAVGGK